MTTTTPATDYAAAVAAIADDIVRQLEDGDAPRRRVITQAAGGHYFEPCRIFYADIVGVSVGGSFTIPAGVARIALDLDATHARNYAHEVRVCFDPPGDGRSPNLARLHAAYVTDMAADIAAAVLDLLDPTADYAR